MPPFKTIAVAASGKWARPRPLLINEPAATSCSGRNADKLREIRATLDRLNAWMDEHVGASSRKPRHRASGADLAEIDGQVDLVMDCIAEDMEQKAASLGRFERSAAKGDLHFHDQRPAHYGDGPPQRRGASAGRAHFWNPPHLMPLVEVIRGEQTPDWVMDRVCELVEDIGKIAVRVERDVPGFIGNRLLHAMWCEAIHLVETGVATPADIDRVTRLTFSLRQPAVGPFENMDLVGLELVHAIQSYLFADLAKDDGPQPPVLSRLRDGQLGMKSGRGFYDWQTRKSRRASRTPRPADRAAA